MNVVNQTVIKQLQHPASADGKQNRGRERERDEEKKRKGENRGEVQDEEPNSFFLLRLHHFTRCAASLYWQHRRSIRSFSLSLYSPHDSHHLWEREMFTHTYTGRHCGERTALQRKGEERREKGKLFNFRCQDTLKQNIILINIPAISHTSIGLNPCTAEQQSSEEREHQERRAVDQVNGKGWGTDGMAIQ